jgi:hypothetical protein
MVAYGIEEKYGVRYQTVSEEEARKIPYLRVKQAFYGPYVYGKSNYGTWDEDNGIVYFNENMFNDRFTALVELGHETGAVIIASQYGGKGNIPKVDGTTMNQKTPLNKLVDKYTFGELEPAPGAARKLVLSNPPEEDETEYPGGTSQYLMDGIIIGSLKHRQGGPYLGWPGGPNIQRIGWQIQYPELEARLEEAKKRGWTGEGMALPKMGTDIWEKSWAKNPPAIKSSNRVNIHIPKIISIKWYTEATLKSNRDKLFLFGDNEARKGKGGQAEYCRGKPNAMGIRTKKSPSLKDGAFWTDKNYQENIKMMADDFMAVFDAGYETIVLPTAGIGTGLAQLKDRAPKTYRWLSSMMKQLSALEE